MLSVGIVGLPNVGKSTLFNAFLKRQQALTANYPFATIDPNIGVVDVIDKRLDKLADLYEKEKGKTPPIVYSNVEFVDIAGLVQRAHQGEGLGNKFLANIRNVDLIIQVVRDFPDEAIIREHSKDPKTDIEIINTELIFKDVETMTRKISEIKGDTSKKEEFVLYNTYLAHLGQNNFVYELRKKIDSTDYDKYIAPLNLLTDKKMIYVFNVNESDARMRFSPVFDYKRFHAVYVSAKLESELSILSEEDKASYLNDLKLPYPILDRLIRLCFDELNLISFLTVGDIEVKSWTIKNGDSALTAAGTIHSDFMDNFIKAEVISYKDYAEYGSKLKCKELVKMRFEGKDYIVQDGDIIEFKIGSGR